MLLLKGVSWRKCAGETPSLSMIPVEEATFDSSLGAARLQSKKSSLEVEDSQDGREAPSGANIRDSPRRAIREPPRNAVPSWGRRDGMASHGMG